MPKVKYIAAGFMQDAEKVLSEFVGKESLEFSDFTPIWKKHNFAAIFMGRSLKQLEQFIQEIFQLTLKILDTPELFRKIGAVYLLYALFRNQPGKMPVKIRITVEQHEHFLELKKLAVKRQSLTLHYVISFLMERDGFQYVARPNLMGPKHKSKKEEGINSIVQNLKDSSKSLLEDNTLKEIEELSDTYAELTKDKSFFTTKKNMSDIKKDLKLFKEEMGLLHAGIYNSEASCSKEQDNIGSRRAQIKSNAFASKALFKQLNQTDEDTDEGNKRFTRSRSRRESLAERAELLNEAAMSEDDLEYVEKGAKPKRSKPPSAPKEQRRAGRPKKEEKELEKLLIGIEEVDDVSIGTKLKGIKKHGPTPRTSCLDNYAEEPLKEPSDKLVHLNLSSDEDISDNKDYIAEDSDEFNITDNEDGDDFDPDEVNVTTNA